MRPMVKDLVMVNGEQAASTGHDPEWQKNIDYWGD